MYMDYNDSTPRTHDNLYNNIWKDLGLALGTAAGGAAFRYQGKGMIESAEGAINSYNNKTMKSTINDPYGTKTNDYRSAARSKVRGKAAVGFGKKLTSISNIFGWASMGIIGARMASSALKSGQAFRTTKQQMERDNFKSQNDQDTYYDTRAAYTQRQRALQVIHNSRLSLKPMLGNEASYLHY